MHAHSYKHFLTSLEGLPRLSSLRKLALFVFAILIITFGVVSTLLYYQYTRETPIRLKKTYLENTIVQFNSTKSSTDELIKNFQVTGSKFDIINTQPQSQTKDAYYIAIDDLERLMRQIKLAQENLNLAKQQETLPTDFVDLDAQIANHNQELSGYLNELLKSYQIAKDITIALGPDLYLQVLIDENLWEKKDKGKIISYYEQKLDSTDSALAKLSQIFPPDKFTNYHSRQIAYLELLANLAQDVINILSVQDDTLTDSATQLEKAYGKVTAAETLNRDLVQKIQDERVSLFDTKKNLNDFAKIKITQNSIGVKLEYFASQYAQIKVINLPNINSDLF